MRTIRHRSVGATYSRGRPGRGSLVTVILATAAAGWMALALPSPAAASPRLAFSASDGADRPVHIFTIGSDGAALQRLTTGTAHDLAPAWSPGRGTIAFIRSRSGDPYDRRAWVMLMRSDGTNKRVLAYTGPSLTSGSHQLAYSPNGRYLAGGTSLRTTNGYGYRWAVTILDLKTHKSRIIYRYASENGIVSLTWAPDSSQLVANVEYGGGYGMFRIRVATARLIKSYRMNIASASWKPGANRLLCCQWFPNEAGAPMRTVLRRLDGTRVEVVGEGQYSAVYSPDGTEYAFFTYEANGGASLRRAKSDGSDVTTIYTAAPGGSLWPAAWR